MARDPGPLLSTIVESIVGYHNGQSRWPGNRIGVEASLYNIAGRRLAGGDLDAKDFRRIAKNLPPGALIMVLNRHEPIAHAPELASNTSRTKRFLASHCDFIIIHQAVLLVHRDSSQGQPHAHIKGLVCRRISRIEATKLIMNNIVSGPTT